MTTDTTTTLYIRGISRSTVQAMKHAAAVRRITLGRYIERLVALHEHMRLLEEQGADCETVTHGILGSLDLETVSG